MATINLLLGCDAILITLGVTLGALTCAAQGIRNQAGRRWNLITAFVLGYIAWVGVAGIGPDFARATDARLISHPADASAWSAVILSYFVGVIILVAVMYTWQRRRIPGART